MKIHVSKYDYCVEASGFYLEVGSLGLSTSSLSESQETDLFQEKFRPDHLNI